MEREATDKHFKIREEADGDTCPYDPRRQALFVSFICLKLRYVNIYKQRLGVT